jgi:hypothetical protein
MFGLPGIWTGINVAAIDFYPNTGELTLPLNIVGLWFSEVDIVYTAGLAVIPDPVKFACADCPQRTGDARVECAHREGRSHADGLLLGHTDRSERTGHAGAVCSAEGGLSHD